MANTIAVCTGVDKTGRSKRATRLGSHYASGEANTWVTFATCTVWSDGHGYVEVKRDGKILHRFEFGPEAEPDAEVELAGIGESVVQRVIGG